MSRLNVTAVVKPIARPEQPVTDTGRLNDFTLYVSVSNESGECTKALKASNFKIQQFDGSSFEREVVGVLEEDGFYVVLLEAKVLSPGHHAFGVAVEAGSKKKEKRVETGILPITIPTDFGQTTAAGYLPT